MAGVTGRIPVLDTAFWYFQEWQKNGTWGRVEDALRKAVGLAEGRLSATPSAGIVDSQTVEGNEQPGPLGLGRVRGAAPAVGGRADVRVAGAVVAVEPELRAHAGERQGGGASRPLRNNDATARQDE